ncbi:TIGR00297 family protein [Synechococcales cyanobacterium C]|uniref:TIGR00297 family protein n=1 Tax=Petrachloros mirabilis ULC683 TaxID=2781853 RepID=A0A8K1ZZE2_9CYAN|nr:TIGR00297 family protein [Petrachloros mirabilis]NCJ06916.1 TIGR00297 family protein [Petrachloros mirabilis ULC683]
MVDLNPWLIALVLNTGLIVAAWLGLKKLLTPAGWLHAWVLGVLIWGLLGWQGYGVVVFYFLVGSGVTRVGLAEKEAVGIAEKRSGARGPENVWGSAATATLCALGTLILPSTLHPLLVLGYVASFSTKLSDTTASEIGKAYGRRTYLVTTFKLVPPGTEGAISLEGTLAGVVASLAIAVLAWGMDLISLLGIALCVGAALIATHLESIIGATLQPRWSWLTNEWVNVINTLIGAIAAMTAQALLWGGLIP